MGTTQFITYITHKINLLKSVSAKPMKRCGSLNSFWIRRCPLPIEVPYQVLTTGEDACLRFWDLRQSHTFSAPTNGGVSPESYPGKGDRKWETNAEKNRKPLDSSHEQAAFQLFAQPVRWTSSLGQMLKYLKYWKRKTPI